MDVNSRIELFLELVSCCHELSYWLYDSNFSLISTNCKDEKLFPRLLFDRKEINEKILANAQEESTPLITSIQTGIEWASIFEKENGKLKYIHILGPLYPSEISRKTIEVELDKHYNMSLRYRNEIINNVISLPVVPPSRFFPYVQMLHYCVTGEKIAFIDIRQEALKKACISPVDDEERPVNRHSGVYAAEQELFKMIEEGNLNYEVALKNAAFKASYGSAEHGGDPIRKALSVGITFIALSIRAAIRGGLPPSTAYAVGDYYENLVSNSNSVTDIASVLNTMYADFIRRVHKCRSNPNISKPIQACCDYIKMNASEKITLETLADIAGYTQYYLTRKFKKEIGISIWDFINEAKIERAKVLLLDPTLTIQDISNMLNYCSRSYFSEVFQKYVDCSPSEYRKNELMM